MIYYQIGGLYWWEWMGYGATLLAAVAGILGIWRIHQMGKRPAEER